MNVLPAQCSNHQTLENRLVLSGVPNIFFETLKGNSLRGNVAFHLTLVRGLLKYLSELQAEYFCKWLMLYNNNLHITFVHIYMLLLIKFLVLILLEIADVLYQEINGMIEKFIFNMTE